MKMRRAQSHSKLTLKSHGMKNQTNSYLTRRLSHSDSGMPKFLFSEDVIHVMANLLLVCWCFAVRCISRLVTRQAEKTARNTAQTCWRHLMSALLRAPAEYRERAYTARVPPKKRPSSTCSTGNNSRPEGTGQITGNRQPHHPHFSSTSSDGLGLLASTAFCAHCLSSGGGSFLHFLLLFLIRLGSRAICGLV